jgi:hypothetical protein
MTTLRTRADIETKKDFRERALALGLDESKLLLKLVREEINSCGDTNQEFVEPNLDNIDMKKLSVRMPRFLAEAAKNKARSKGMTLTRWIANMVQSNLMRLPVMTKKEIYVLQSSNRELAAIGRNINQIARSLNEAFYKTEAVRLEKLAELSREISKNREAIHELIKASQNVWEADWP